jgi:hypothetical protein
MNKKFISVFIILIITISFVLFILLNNKNKTSVSSIVPSKPVIQGGLQGNFSEKATFNKLDFNFSKTLPVLNITLKEISKDYVFDLKNRLNFNNELTEFNDIKEGIKYYVNSDNYSLVTTPKTSKIKYAFSPTIFPEANDLELSDEALKSNALNFINENLLNTNNILAPSNIIYLKRNIKGGGFEKTTREEAEIFQVNFSMLSNNNYQIVNSYSANPSTFVQLLKNGNIYYFETILFQEIREGLTNYPLKNMDDIKNNINEAKLVNVFGDYLSISEISIKNIDKIEINDIKIAYLLEEKNNDYLQPIYLLYGNIEISGSSANNAILYIPAFSSKI